MIEEVQSNVFRVRIPLPGSPLKYLNSYVLKTDNRSLVIDTGFNKRECLDAMCKAMQGLCLDPDRTDLFLTHYHIDHIGLVSELASSNTEIYFGRIEAESQRGWNGFDAELMFIVRHGFPKHLIPPMFQSYAARHHFPVKWLKDARLIDDGDSIELGPFRLECIHTPGHSPGHMCLYEPNHKILFCGDHLLANISPIIMCWSEKENRLKAYLENLCELRNLDVRTAYPGHNRLIMNPRKIINRILAHHERRLAEVMDLLSERPQSAFATASKMRWNLTSANWDNFPDEQKCFATSEAVAHLRYLEMEGEIHSLCENEQIYYYKN